MNVAGCGCDWDMGDCCDKCLTHPDNPEGLIISKEAHDHTQALFDRWAAEA